MKLAEYCNTSPGYIGEIEMGRKFPSTEMIERIAKVLRVEPYHLFRDWTKVGNDSDTGKIYPILPVSMKNEIKGQIESAINGIFDKY
ncbi:MAG: helix-turn-helix transcriptional regulator [Treponema sp.]|nr:helix-turn-helix transcriptional regulator [Treponema sp.]